MSWRWEYHGADLAPDAAGSDGFPSQSDAESWLGEEWRDLLEQGVDSVWLFEEGREVYGPMSLRPVE